MNENEKDIDLNKLSHRELLILVHSDVKELKRTQKVQTEKQQSFEVQLTILKTQSKIWGAFIGCASGIGASLIFWLITK
jgi:hypothetical protein